MDFGQYSKKDVLSKLKPKKGSGTCAWCGKPTRAETILGTTICNACWERHNKKR